MNQILDMIAKATRIRIREAQSIVPLAELKQKAEDMDCSTGFPFEKAVAGKDLSFICEVKKASPSRGVIAEDYTYVEIAKEYEAAGASAISCLTEPYYFQGENKHLQEIAKAVKLPILRKDFTVSPYMIYEAKVLGASAVLLVVSILKEGQLEEYMEIAHSLGLSALVEAHTEEEVKKAVACGATIIGVNNRDLKTFKVDMTTSNRLRTLVPESCIFVAESGVHTREDVALLQKNGTNAILIGEAMMRAENKKEMLQQLRGETKA